MEFGTPVASAVTATSKDRSPTSPPLRYRSTLSGRRRRRNDVDFDSWATAATVAATASTAIHLNAGADDTQAYSARSSRLLEPTIHSDSEGADGSQTETPTDVSDSTSPWPFSDSRTVTGDVLSASRASTVSITSGGPGNALGPQVFVPLIVVLVLFIVITVFVFARRALRWRRRVVDGPTLLASAHSGRRHPWPAGTWAERHGGRPNVVVTVARTTSPPISLVLGASSHSESVGAPEDTTSIFGQDGSALTQLPDSHPGAWELAPPNSAPSPIHRVKGERRTRNQPPEAMPPPPPPRVFQDETSSSPPVARETLAQPETGNPDTVLLRLPADLARGLMALVAGSGNAGEAMYAGGSENGENVESLPPYESEPSRSEVNRPRADS